MKYLPLARLAYSLILRPFLVRMVARTTNKIDDNVIEAIDHALAVESANTLKENIARKFKS